MKHLDDYEIKYYKNEIKLTHKDYLDEVFKYIKDKDYIFNFVHGYNPVRHSYHECYHFINVNTGECVKINKSVEL